jgi:hypothetical protein
MQTEARYKTYILRLWQDQPVVFATLDDCQTHQRKAFANLAALVDFLEAAEQQESQKADCSERGKNRIKQIQD